VRNVTERLQSGNRVLLPGTEVWATVTDVIETATGWRVYADTDGGDTLRRDLTPEQAEGIEVISEDGSAESVCVLAGLWTEWMQAATYSASATALATTPLRPYAHQDNAVYGAMLPQPRLRFLLADEPGTGKTIMAGMYLREMRRLGLVNRALVVSPAHLVTKWQADFERFFGGGLKRITSNTAKDGPLRPDQDLWITSLDLAAVNPMVQEVIRPDRAGWDVVVIDEAHRLTPTAQGYYQVGRMLSYGSPRILLMTATPHRGSEWLFRSLLHLLDPAVFPSADKDEDLTHHVKPGRIHFIRRMKEELLDYDGITPLFKRRKASNIAVPLNAAEAAFYQQALELVDTYFPPASAALARMVYGKRAASSLYALAETLRRRRDHMGAEAPVVAGAAADPENEDPPSRDEAKVTHEVSRSAKAERIAISQVLAELEPVLTSDTHPASKWPAIENDCLTANGIVPGNGEQAVVFTEYADTADWLVSRFQGAGYTARRYSGRDPYPIRDETRTAFAEHGFQILVSTDAGNEGIDLQSAHVLVNWDIPWSLVRLEQRMGRIHRLGQERDVELYNLIATDTREGEALQVLLDNLVTAANRLDGKLFDCLSLVAENLNLDLESLLARAYDDRAVPQDVMNAARAMTAARLEAEAKKATREERFLRSPVDITSALAVVHKDALDRVNPHIIEIFLARLSAAGVLTASRYASGDGIFLVRAVPGGLLPAELGGGGQAIVATSIAAVDRALREGSTATGVTVLGPGGAAFRSLVAAAQQRLRPQMFQGGTLSDRTTSTGYDVACYEAKVTEGSRRTIWQFLIRVDDTGARRIRWESLANLASGDKARRALHPARAADADTAARDAADAERAKRLKALGEWLSAARHDLSRLPDTLTSDIAEPVRRSAERRRLEAAVADNLANLEQMATVHLGDVRRIGWAHVVPAGPPPDPTEKDSEDISMRLVGKVLRSAGWGVADVHSEDRGYDLLAIKGRRQLCIEVKGVWYSASASGVVLTGNELLIAGQMGRDYWLWVVDGCSDRAGKTFGIYADPATEFAGLTKDQTLIRVPGSVLKSARQEAVPT
jgi:superfamily II DNA or RNA helicase